jgi:copper chaperone CopZ
MRRFLFTPLLMVPALALAQTDDYRCVVSFDSAKLDTCANEVHANTKGLPALADLDAFKDSTLRVVKFDGPIRDEQRRALLATGAEIIGYAP